MRIPATRQSERYCRDCKGLTKRQRINANARARRQAARLAKVANVKEKEGENHEAPFSSHAGSEEQAGPSTMIASTGAVGGGFHHSAENSFSAPLDTEEAEEVDDRFVPLAEVNPPRPRLTGFMQHARHVGGSEKVTVDAHADEEQPSTNLFPHVTLDDQGGSPDTSTGSPTHPPFPHRSPSFWAAVKSVGTQQRIRREMYVSPESSAFKKPRLE
ncbi:hypothetical protein MMC22_006368 [Lobaria immixta]|nr:hypothetical protein [Lobaria immixta]